jgi:hypothetical protein
VETTNLGTWLSTLLEEHGCAYGERYRSISDVIDDLIASKATLDVMPLLSHQYYTLQHSYNRPDELGISGELVSSRVKLKRNCISIFRQT